MKKLEAQKQLSESLLAACKAAGIEEPRYIAQDQCGLIYHYNKIPYLITRNVWGSNNGCGKKINHAAYTSDWQESLLEWVDHVADTSKITPSGIEAMVCEDIAKRQQVGIAKYGVTVADNPLAHMQWLQHAYEECLDMAVYLKRSMEIRRSK